MRSPVQRVSCLIFASLLALLLGSAVVHPDSVTARALPQHCDDLAHGDCDSVWFCLVACFMEMLGLEEFCSQHPNSPQCQ